MPPTRRLDIVQGAFGLDQRDFDLLRRAEQQVKQRATFAAHEIGLLRGDAREVDGSRYPERDGGDGR